MGGGFSINLHIVEGQDSIDVEFACKDTMTIKEIKEAMYSD